MMVSYYNLRRLLSSDPEGRKRGLQLRTYTVTCLNEECGLLEWVNNTQGQIAQIITYILDNADRFKIFFVL